ncbi:MAG: ATP-binding protein [Marinoscillum sp.]
MKNHNKRIGVLCFWLTTICFNIHAQPKVDSLKNLLVTNLGENEWKQTALHLLMEFRFQPDSVIKYGHLVMERLSEDDLDELATAKFNLGQAHKNKGSYELSIEYLYDALQIKKQLGTDPTAINVVLGGVFGKIGDMKKSSEYFQKALEVDSLFLKNDFHYLQTYNNLADAYFLNGYYDSAFYYFNQAYDLAELNNYVNYERFITGNLGMVNLKLGNLDSAEVQLKSVLNFIKRDLTSFLTFQTFLAEVYLEQKKYNQSEDLIHQVILQAEKSEFKEQIRDGYLLLSKLYEGKQDYEKSLLAYRQYVLVEFDLRDVETVRKIGDMRTGYEVGQKQVEVDLLTAEKNNQRLIIIAMALSGLFLTILLSMRYRSYRRKIKLTAELERLNQTKDKFFSIISHDLRGPISAFKGISRVIKFLVISKETDELMDVADDIDHSVDRLSELLDNLLGWAMQQQGHFPNVPEKLSLKELLHELVGNMETMAKGKNINLEVKVHETIELWVDRNTTMTILRNLVTNALKFTPERGMVIISTEEDGNYANIKVMDTGIGIPRDQLKKLFRLQERSSTYGTSGEKGLGLGLQLVHEFVEMNNGTLHVESEEGKGTIFTVSLPLFEAKSVQERSHS